MLSALLGCKNNSSLIDAYRFPTTQDVKVDVSVNFNLTDENPANLDFTKNTYSLYTYALDGSTDPILTSIDGSNFFAAQAISPNSQHFKTTMTLRIPTTVHPRENGGYALKMKLVETATTTLASSDDVSLTALKDGVKASNASAENGIDLSIASTIASQIIENSLTDPGSNAAIQGYQAIVTKLSSTIIEMQKAVIVTTSLSPSLYVAAISNAAKYIIINSKDLQQALTDLLTVAGGTSIESSSKLAKGFTDTLVSFATSVQTNLGDPMSETSKVFKTNTIDPTKVPDPTSYDTAVFAPTSLVFTDTDNTVTIGGSVSFTAPQVKTGIESYKIYLGGEDRANSRQVLLGSVSASSNETSFTIPAGTSIAGVTRIWIYPVASGVELTLPASLVIVNIQTDGGGAGGSGGATTAFTWDGTLSITGGIGKVTISWPAATGATSYRIERGTTSGSYTSVLTSSATSPYVDENVAVATPYYYRVTAVKGTESASAPEATAQVNWTPIKLGEGSIFIVHANTGTPSAIDADSNLYVVGYYQGGSFMGESGSPRKTFLLKYKKDGTLEWSRVISTSGTMAAVRSITLDVNNELSLVGVFDGTTSGMTAIGNYDAMLLHYDRDGNLLWARQEGIATKEINGYASASDAAGNIYMIGVSNIALTGSTSVGTVDSYLVKYNSAGARQWAKMIGTASTTTTLYGIRVDANGDVYLVGSSNGAKLIKLDSSGNEVWRNSIGSDTSNGARNLAFDSSNNVYVIGASYESFGGQTLSGFADGMILKYDTAGTLIWMRFIGATAAITLDATIAIDAEDHIFAVVSSTSSLYGAAIVGNTNTFVSRYDSLGNREWTSSIPAAASKRNIPGCVVIDPNGGDVIITGTTTATTSGANYQLYIEKFNVNGTLSN